MRLSQKVGKLGTGEVIESARRHLRRAVLSRRRCGRLDAEELVNTIDPQRFAAIRERYATDNPGEAWPKYLDLTKWMAKNLCRARDLGLDVGFRKRILDLGCGAGYFLYIAQLLGHEVVGLDIDQIPMFGEMMLILGLTRVIWRVQPFVRLPQFGQKFDLITAFMICFNGHKSAALWGPKEWRFFLDDLETHLRPNGRICLGLNRENDSSFYSEDVRRFFASRGAKMEADRVILTLRLWRNGSTGAQR